MGKIMNTVLKLMIKSQKILPEKSMPDMEVLVQKLEQTKSPENNEEKLLLYD